MPETRSRNGCWTCRLRKRKCDETRPQCQACNAHNLVCHGFGQRPECMDNGPLQQVEIRAIKLAISNETRRRRSTRPPHSHLGLNQSSASLDFGQNFNNSGFLSTNLSSSYTSQVTCDGPPIPTCVERTHDSNVDDRVAIEGFHSEPEVRSSVGAIAQHIAYDLTFQKSLLLIHYLQEVFPWQFPLLNLQPNTRQKGSLLNIILRSPPLILSVVALSGSFLNRKEATNGSNLGIQPTQVEQDYQGALREFRLALHSSGETFKTKWDLSHALTVASTFLMLTYTSVLRGDGSWRLHTSAALHIIPFHTNWNKISLDAFEQRTTEIRNSSLAHQQWPPCQVDEQMASTYLIESMLWLQILCWLTDGHSLAPYDEYITFLEHHNSPVELRNLMGCDDSILACILRIQSLHHWKEQVRGENAVDVWSFTQTAMSIQAKLGSRATFTMSPDPPELFHGIITWVFTCAAAIFLEVVVSGDYPCLPKVRQAILEMKKALDVIQDPQLFKILAWPLCVAGSMSELEHHSYFVDLLTSHMESVEVLREVLKLLHQSWRMRKEDIHHKSNGLCWVEARKQLNENFCLI